MKNINIKGIIKKISCLSMVVVMLGITLSGCASKEDNSVKDLTVYYVKGTSYYSSALDFYSKLDSKINLKSVEFNTEDEMTNKLAGEMASGDGPDVILLSDKTTLDVYKSIRGENFADLTSYFTDDKDFSMDDYYQNIINGVKVNGKQYIVPFNFDVNTYYMKKSVKDKLQINKFDLSLNFGDFMKSVLNYQTQLQTDDNMELTLSALSSSGGVSLIASLCRTCGLKAVDESGNICVSKSDVQATFNVLKSIITETTKKKDALAANASGIDSYGHVDTFFCNFRNSPFTISILNGLLASKFNDSLTFEGIPNTNGDGGYNANIISYGVVNSNSKNISEGYKLIKYMMNYDYKSEYENYSLPVKKSAVSSILEKVKLGYKSYNVSTTESITTVPWDNDTVEDFNYLLEHITTASFANTKVEEIINNTMQGYISGTDSFDICYDKMINQLKLYLQEWYDRENN